MLFTSAPDDGDDGYYGKGQIQTIAYDDIDKLPDDGGLDDDDDDDDGKDDVDGEEDVDLPDSSIRLASKSGKHYIVRWRFQI